MDFLRWYFYPRPPGGGRLFAAKTREEELAISIHALRVEGDVSTYQATKSLLDFYPRPPGGGRLLNTLQVSFSTHIFLSTPSGWRATRLLATSTCNRVVFLSTPSGWRATARSWRRKKEAGYFYPRPPGGGRQSRRRSQCCSSKFLSTPSGWRATIS